MFFPWRGGGSRVPHTYSSNALGEDNQDHEECENGLKCVYSNNVLNFRAIGRRGRRQRKTCSMWSSLLLSHSYSWSFKVSSSMLSLVQNRVKIFVFWLFYQNRSHSSDAQTPIDISSLLFQTTKEKIFYLLLLASSIFSVCLSVAK